MSLLDHLGSMFQRSANRIEEPPRPERIAALILEDDTPWTMIWEGLRNKFGENLETRSRSLMECRAYNTVIRLFRRRELDYRFRGYSFDQVETNFRLTDEERGIILPSLIERQGILNGRRL